jgi:hypothetical protein
MALSLGLEPLETVHDQPVVVVPDSVTDRTQEDFTKAHDTMVSSIDTAHEALIELADIAHKSSHPRAYEVLATLTRTLVDASRDLVELRALDRSRTNPETPQPVAGTTVNNLFVGSTRGLQDFLKNMRENHGSREA